MLESFPVLLSPLLLRLTSLSLRENSNLRLERKHSELSPREALVERMAQRAILPHSPPFPLFFTLTPLSLSSPT